MRDELNRWMKRFPPMGNHSYSDKIELARMEKAMNNLEKRQKGFRSMISMKRNDKYSERPILKVLDVPDDAEHGSIMWHLNNLCGVLNCLIEESPEYNYIKEVIEYHLEEHEKDQSIEPGPTGI